VLLSGCYTVIMHPEVADEDIPGDQLRVECVDCHKDYHVYPYDPYEHYFNSDYYWHYPRFGYYYGYPWWWDDYYWYYYFSPDDPQIYPPTTREIDRPAYRGGAPERSTGGYTPDMLNTRGSNVLTPRNPYDPPTAPGDTTGTDDTTSGRSRDALNILPPEDRTIGQPPWQKPIGGVKPPRLRDDVKQESNSDESKSNSTESGATKPVQPVKPPDTKKSEPEEQQQKDAEPRGKPKRTPR
jgi:hypothetical protein